MSARVIFVTERDTFKFCRRQWKYGYLWDLVPKQQGSTALVVGRAVHKAIEAYYRGENPIEWLEKYISGSFDFKHIPGEDRTKLDEHIELSFGIVRHYLKYWGPRQDFFDKSVWEIVGVEIPLQYRLSHGVYLRGRLDMLVRHLPTKKLKVVDHKCVAGFVEPADLWLDDQMTTYLWLVWKIFGELPGGAIYNQVRRKVPSVPAVLKAGGLSRAQIDTTPDVYRQAVIDAGLNLADYTDMIAKLTDATFFRREDVSRTKTELENHTAQLAAEVVDIKRPKESMLYPRPSRDCQWACDFLTLCKAENEGGDVPALIQHLYDKGAERRQKEKANAETK